MGLDPAKSGLRRWSLVRQWNIVTILLSFSDQKKRYALFMNGHIKTALTLHGSCRIALFHDYPTFRTLQNAVIPPCNLQSNDNSLANFDPGIIETFVSACNVK